MKTATMCLLAASAITIAASATALAHDRGHRPWSGERFSSHVLERLDLDSNGSVSLEEFMTSTDHRFEAADANDDGIVTEDEISELVEERGAHGGMHFLQRLDSDGDGKLSLEEATQLALDRAKRRFQRADADGDGFIAAEEVAKIGSRRAGRHAPRFAGRMMQRFDADDDGKITKAEADEHRKMRFAHFDTDKDGQVTAEELQAGMKDYRGRHRRGGWRFHR